MCYEQWQGYIQATARLEALPEVLNTMRPTHLMARAATGKAVELGCSDAKSPATLTFGIKWVII